MDVFTTIMDTATTDITIRTAVTDLRIQAPTTTRQARITTLPAPTTPILDIPTRHTIRTMAGTVMQCLITARRGNKRGANVGRVPLVKLSVETEAVQ